MLYGFSMIKFWFYVSVLLVLAVFGLAVGSANDTLISFDFLFVKKEISVATVLVIGVIFGFILGVYASLLLCLKMWYRAKKAKLSLNKVQKQLRSVKTDNKQE